MTMQLVGGWGVGFKVIWMVFLSFTSYQFVCVSLNFFYIINFFLFFSFFSFFFYLFCFFYIINLQNCWVTCNDNYMEYLRWWIEKLVSMWRSDSGVIEPKLGPVYGFAYCWKDRITPEIDVAVTAKDANISIEGGGVLICWCKQGLGTIDKISYLYSTLKCSSNVLILWKKKKKNVSLNLIRRTKRQDRRVNDWGGASPAKRNPKAVPRFV